MELSLDVVVELQRKNENKMQQRMPWGERVNGKGRLYEIGNSTSQFEDDIKTLQGVFSLR